MRATFSRGIGLKMYSSVAVRVTRSLNHRRATASHRGIEINSMIIDAATSALAEDQIARTPAARYGNKGE